MTTISGKNFSKTHRSKLADLDVQNGDTFERCNFSQSRPDTEILAGYTGLTFQSCNCRNCKLPGDAVLIDTPNSQIDRCSHLHPTKSELVQCAENCKHVIDTDTVTIDGQAVGTIFHYADIREA